VERACILLMSLPSFLMIHWRPVISECTGSGVTRGTELEVCPRPFQVHLLGKSSSESDANSPIFSEIHHQPYSNAVILLLTACQLQLTYTAV